MNLVSQGELEIQLPRAFIGGNDRVKDGKEEFLKAYEDKVDEVMGRLVEASKGVKRVPLGTKVE